MSFKSRTTEDFQWYFWFLIRSIIYGYVVFRVLRFVKRKIPRVLGYGPICRDPDFRKLRRVRVKNPPIRLKDFDSVESMREGISEVVAFLQNPRAFQEMGARAPWGIGRTKIINEKNEGSMKANVEKNEGSMNGNVESRAYCEKRLVFFFGSYVAVQLLLPFEEENILSSSEIKQAQEIATRMVIQYGWGPDDSTTIYHHGNAGTTLSMGNNHEYEMAGKVEKI